MIYLSSYSAKRVDPVSAEMEYYVTVGLNSNIRESDFKRKKINFRFV